MDDTFTGDWPTLFGSETNQLRSVFLGDPDNPISGIVELVVFEGVTSERSAPDRPAWGFFLLSLQRDVEQTLARLADLGFDDGVRRITMHPPDGGTDFAMAVITAPDGVVVELIGAPM
jgi:glyoxylase I family protein